MGTLHVQYLEKMVGSVFSTLSNIDTTGEIVESNIKNGKLLSTVGALSGKKKLHSNFHKKNEGKENVAMGSSRRKKAHYPLSLPYHQVVAGVPVQYQQ